MRLTLYPGWPLPDSDYVQLSDLLASLPGAGHLIVGHSLGALLAMNHSVEADTKIILLAPSLPGPRRGRWILASALGAAGRITRIDQKLGASLRRQTYLRYGVLPREGAALSARQAARTLTLRSSPFSGPAKDCLVVTGFDDKRSRRQLEFAHASNVNARVLAGGHLFPITEPKATVDAISAWLREGA